MPYGLEAPRVEVACCVGGRGAFLFIVHERVEICEGDELLLVFLRGFFCVFFGVRGRRRRGERRRAAALGDSLSLLRAQHTHLVPLPLALVDGKGRVLASAVGLWIEREGGRREEARVSDGSKGVDGPATRAQPCNGNARARVVEVYYHAPDQRDELHRACTPRLARGKRNEWAGCERSVEARGQSTHGMAASPKERDKARERSFTAHHTGRQGAPGPPQG